MDVGFLVTLEKLDLPYKSGNIIVLLKKIVNSWVDCIIDCIIRIEYFPAFFIDYSRFVFFLSGPVCT